MDIAFEHEIRRRAYAIWVASGKNEGEAEAHWLHAERAVRSEAKTAIVSTAKAKPAKAAATMKDATVEAAGTKAAMTKATKTKAAAKANAATKTSAASRRPKAGPVEAVV